MRRRTVGGADSVKGCAECGEGKEDESEGDGSAAAVTDA